MNQTKYSPERGDIIWINFNPQAGKEQMGRRPAFVVSPKEYNSLVGLVIVCPITCKIKNYPFEVKLDNKLLTKGVIISDQIKSLDWKVREAEFIEKCSQLIVDEVLEKIALLIKN